MIQKGLQKIQLQSISQCLNTEGQYKLLVGGISIFINPSVYIKVSAAQGPVVRIDNQESDYGINIPSIIVIFNQSYIFYLLHCNAVDKAKIFFQG